MDAINIKCQGCGKTHQVSRTKEIPNEATSMWCNWCPECDNIDEDYLEGYNFDTPKEQTPQNQLQLFGVEDSLTAIQVMSIIKERDSK